MRLPDVLDELDLPLAELCASRLDGELFALGEGFRPVDSPPDLRARAVSLTTALRPGKIGHRTTAAWVFGALSTVPRPLPVCVHAGRSKGVDPEHGIQLAEAILTDDEVWEVAGVHVTSPLRTVVDLVRLPTLTSAEHDAVLRLMVDFGISGAAVEEQLMDRRFQRERLRARRHLDEVGARLGHPAETR